jgi:hypothetical protein
LAPITLRAEAAVVKLVVAAARLAFRKLLRAGSFKFSGGDERQP